MSALAEPVAPVTRVVPLTEVVELNPRPDRAALRDDLEVSFIPMAAVEAGSGRMDATEIRRFGEVKKGYTTFREGDVLFAKITPCMENGKMAVARGLRNGIGCGSTEFHVLRPRPGVDAHYVYHFVSSARFRAEAAHHMTGAVGQKRVPAAFLEQCVIPLPDLDAQRRIVAELEKQFSRLDRAVANLKRVKSNLKRYKAAVLKAAVEGRLVPTEAELARRESRPYEPGAKLLARLLEERTTKKREAGKKLELVQPHASDLPPPLEGWTWGTTVQVCAQVVDCHNKTAPYVDAGIPLIRTTNVRDGRMLLDDLRYVDQSTYVSWSRRCPPEPGDVLFTREAPMGEAGIIPPSLRPCMGQRLMLMRPSAAIRSGFLLIALISPLVRSFIDKVAVGSGVKHLRVGDVERLLVPLPPLAEQVRIEDEVSRRLSIVDALTKETDDGVQHATAMKQAYLVKAFSSASEV